MFFVVLRLILPEAVEKRFLFPAVVREVREVRPEERADDGVHEFGTAAAANVAVVERVCKVAVYLARKAAVPVLRIGRFDAGQELVPAAVRGGPDAYLRVFIAPFREFYTRVRAVDAFQQVVEFWYFICHCAMLG